MMKKQKSNGKIIYINASIKSVTLDIATQYKKEALPTIAKLCDRLTLRGAQGEQVAVTIELDDASRRDKNQYHIEIGVGLIVQLATVARGVAANKHALRGREKTRIIHPELRKHGREKALADFVFHYMLTFVLWHEVAHVVLGHLDWLAGKNGLGMIEEFGYQPLPDNIHTQFQTLEADADRQASIWTSALIDQMTSSNPFLRYLSPRDLFYDIGYIYGSLFGFLDSVDEDVQEATRRHPKPDIRLGVALAFVGDYLKKYHPAGAAILQQQVISGGIHALSQIHHPTKKGIDPLGMFHFMYENGRRLDAMEVRKLQLQIASSPAGSFTILGLE